jgi:outer membrane protein assembly factor BamA
MGYHRIIFGWLICMIIISGCNPTKHVPENEYLLDKYTIKEDRKRLKKNDLKNYVKQKPNKRILGVKFHLWLYNLSNPQKYNWFHRWLRKIGEEPVIYDALLTEKTTQQLNQYLINKGYYNSQVLDSVRFSKKYAYTSYNIKAGDPYFVQKVNYVVHDTSIRPLIFSDTINSVIKTGEQYDLDLLQDERKRLERLMQQNGYFNFSRAFIHFELDSSLGNRRVAINLHVEDAKMGDSPDNSVPHKQYKIKNVNIYPDLTRELMNVSELNQVASFDSIGLDSIQLYYTGMRNIKPGVLVEMNQMEPHDIFNIDKVERTYKNLSSLRVFRLIDIDFEEKDRMSGSSYYPLQCNIKMVPQKRQNYSVAGEFTNSGGDFGLGGNLVYQHKNLFKGAEIFNLTFNGATEWIQDPVTDQYNNYAEYGIESRVLFPKFLVPISIKQFIAKYNPKTSISASYKFQDRPYYTGTITNLRFGYNWQVGRHTTHIINPVDVNAVNADPAPEFERLYQNNLYLLNSYRSHFVAVTNYSFIFNNQDINRKNLDYTFLRTNLEAAGNLLNVANKVAGAEPNDDGNYEIFGLKYAQYFRADLDLRRSTQLNRTDNFVYRLFAGAGFPYNNSKALPFERQYFAGGANSIRAWRVWTLGPGGYPGDTLGYNTADIKLEFNLEYRFKLFWLLEGALFLDAGNIWSINKEDTRENSLFRFNDFYQDIAIGTGFGTRLDFSYFLFRIDLGLKLRDPALQTTNKWIFNNSDFRKDIFAIQVGIGYPF